MSVFTTHLVFNFKHFYCQTKIVSFISQKSTKQVENLINI